MNHKRISEAFFPLLGRMPRIAILLLLTFLFSTQKVWGQTDYSGTYYIASGDTRGGSNISDIHYSSETPANNFYLCPTDEESWICYVDPDNYTNPAEDNDQPFLTTYKYRATEDATPAIWIFEKVTGTEYYYIKHKNTSRYLTYNGKISSTTSRGVNRLRFHLQSTATNNSLFQIVQDEDVPTAVNIIAVAAIDTYMYDGKNAKYLNLSSKDVNSLVGTGDKTDGPTNCKNVGATIGIWYDAGRSSEWFLEEVVPRTTITNTNSNIVFSHSEEGATIYYTTDGTNPSTTNYAGTGTAPLQIDMPENAVTVKAIATIDNLPSCITQTRVVPAASITLAENEYTYTSSAIEPVVSSVKDGETTIDANEYTVSYSNNINAGNTATVTITDKAGGDYIVYGSTTFTINPAEVTLTANSGTKEYDGTEKTLNGFTCSVGGSSVEGLTFTGVTASGSGTNIGNYPVTFTGVTIGTTKDTSGNYVVSETVNGTLTITPKSLTITADSDTKVYDGTALTKNSYTSEGLMEGDVIESVTITGSQTEAGSSNNVPSAAVIKKGDEVVNANYNITYANGTLTINPKPLTITADAKSKAYGEADPALTYTSEGLINNDAITGALTREEGENAGNHAILQGTLTAGNNYAITYNGANLTITKVGLTITAKNNTITYGDAPAGNGVTYEGFVNSETASVLGGTLDYDYSYTKYGNIGNSYTITPKGLTSNNYDITFVDGTLTVNVKEVGLEWTDTALPYNGNEQIPTATATGLVNGDEVGVTVTGAQTNIGNYTATASALTGDKAGNYVLPESNTHSFAITSKSIGEGTTLADGYTLDFSEDNSIILIDNALNCTLVPSVDYSVGDDTSDNDKYSKRTVTGLGNYGGSVEVKNAIVSFNTDTNEDGWSATFSAEKANGTAFIGHALPQGVNAFIITEIKGEWAVPEQLNYIPEGVPVLLVAQEKTNGFVVTDANSEDVTLITDAQKGNNMLEEVTEETPNYNTGTQSAHFDTKQIYLLYKNEFVFNKDGNLKKGKVYLNPNHTVPASSNPARLQIAWNQNQTTGIQDLQDSKTTNITNRVWYTIEGRRLSRKPQAKGLYIVDGKKIAIN